MKKFFIVTLALIVALIATIQVFEYISAGQTDIKHTLDNVGQVIDNTGKQNNNNNIPSGIACTMDALMCPDGTYVGRSGTQCLFVCPDGSVHR